MLKHEHDKCSVAQRVALFVSDCVSRPGGSQRGTRAARLSSGLTFLLAGSAGSVLISMLCCVCVWACPCARACVGVCCSTCARPRTLPCASTLRVFLLSRNASAHARVCACGVRALQDARLRASCARVCRLVVTCGPHVGQFAAALTATSHSLPDGCRHMMRGVQARPAFRRG